MLDFGGYNLKIQCLFVPFMFLDQSFQTEFTNVRYSRSQVLEFTNFSLSVKLSKVIFLRFEKATIPRSFLVQIVFHPKVVSQIWCEANVSNPTNKQQFARGFTRNNGTKSIYPGGFVFYAFVTKTSQSEHMISRATARWEYVRRSTEIQYFNGKWEHFLRYACYWLLSSVFRFVSNAFHSSEAMGILKSKICGVTRLAFSTSQDNSNRHNSLTCFCQQRSRKLPKTADVRT